VDEIDGDDEDQIGMEPEERLLLEGQACPDWGLPLAAQWVSREVLYSSTVVEYVPNLLEFISINPQVPTEPSENGITV
jgi:hypothetical protein